LLGELRRVNGGRSLFVLFLMVGNFQDGRAKQSDGDQSWDMGNAEKVKKSE
jgi:hypothetical protein